MKNHIIIVLSLFGLFSCGKADFCDTDTLNYKVGENSKIESCSSEKFDVYSWYVNGYPVIDLEIQGFPSLGGNFELVNGGGDCDDFLEVKFLKSGTYTILMEVSKISAGSCSSGNWEGSLGKSKEVEVIVTE